MVADELPRANLLILQWLLSLLHHIKQNSSRSRMDSSNLAICIGPNMLSEENLLLLEVLMEVKDKIH